MMYYYVIPAYLTGIFAVSYILVRIVLNAFDRLNVFWDLWDKWRKDYPFLAFVEVLFLGGMTYYIISRELSGSP